MAKPLTINVTAFVSGLIFGLGLILSGMANPAKVLAFLDLKGLWDPSLALVMAGAIIIGLVAFTFAKIRAKKREQSFLGLQIQLPTATNIDKRLVLGALTFGVGWGLAGICPGPSLVLLGVGSIKSFVFVGSMLIGMAIYEKIDAKINDKN